jgi:phosphate/sulfate permease
VGGLVGAGLAGAGLGAINLFGLLRVLIALFVSPAIGLLVGYGLTRLIFFLAQWGTPRINNAFRMVGAAHASQRDSRPDRSASRDLSGLYRQCSPFTDGGRGT